MRRFVLIVSLLVGLSGPVCAQTERPQTPESPFAYRVIDVTIPVLDEQTGEQSHTLGGTLTLPDAIEHGDEPYVGVVLMSGSGMQDRDSTIFEHKPFLVIADYLTRRGIAVLRYDDRVVGDSTGSMDGATTFDLALDGQSAAHFMMQQTGIDPDRVGLLGHSEGGGHVPYIAARDDSIAYVISLAGVGVRGADLMLDQTARIFRESGQDEVFITGSIEHRRAVFESVVGGEDEDVVVENIIKLNMFEYGLSERNEMLVKTSKSMLPAFSGDWVSSFIGYNPSTDWAKVSVPVLAMNGSKDLQVSPELNLGGIRAGLVEGGHENYTIIELAGLNHLFQHAQTGMVGEYSTLTETFAPEALAMIEAWIRSEIVESAHD